LGKPIHYAGSLTVSALLHFDRTTGIEPDDSFVRVSNLPDQQRTYRAWKFLSSDDVWSHRLPWCWRQRRPRPKKYFEVVAIPGASRSFPAALMSVPFNAQSAAIR
jgi:hypothetical protein